MNRNDLPDLFNAGTILGAVLVAGGLLVLTLVLIGWTSARQAPALGFVPADLTIIPPRQPRPVQQRRRYRPARPHLPGRSASVPMCRSRDGGRGLAHPREPGQGGDTVFIGEESEIFQVKEGPQQVDGYTWWYLVAPYDETRAGWAAADYLLAVPPP